MLPSIANMPIACKQLELRALTNVEFSQSHLSDKSDVYKKLAKPCLGKPTSELHVNISALA